VQKGAKEERKKGRKEGRKRKEDKGRCEDKKKKTKKRRGKERRTRTKPKRVTTTQEEDSRATVSSKKYLVYSPSRALRSGTASLAPLPPRAARVRSTLRDL